MLDIYLSGIKQQRQDDWPRAIIEVAGSPLGYTGYRDSTRFILSLPPELLRYYYKFPEKGEGLAYEFKYALADLILRQDEIDHTTQE